MSQEIVEAVREIEREKGIESGHARRRARGRAARRVQEDARVRRATRRVELDDAGDFRVFSIELPEDLEQRLLEEARERTLDELERIEEETGEKNHTLLTDDDLDLDWSQVPEDQIKREDVTPDNFGRIAAQTAKQVILQRIREAEREMMYDEYIDRVGEVVTGIVQQAGDRNNVLVDLGKVEALLPRSEQVDGERYEQGSRIKAVITEVRTGTKGPQVILSRRDPELIKTLFELEVPEIADGLVEIRGVAREPGYRSKIAVESHAQGVDPVGACVGPRGSRVRMVVSELRGEKIDIIPWNPEPARFVAKALSPARVREVYLDDEAQGGDRRRPRRPARARDRQGGHERPPRPPADRLEDRHRQRHRVRPAGGRGGLRRRRRRGRATSRAAARRSSRTASAARTRRCPARSTAAFRPTRSSRRSEPATTEAEPDRRREPSPSSRRWPTTSRARGRHRVDAEPRRRRPSPDEVLPAGPGDAPVTARRRDARVRAARRVERDRGRPASDGVPDRGRIRRADRRRPRPRLAHPIRTCAGCGRKAPQGELQRFHAEDGELVPGAGPGRGVYTCRRLACFERASAHRGFNRRCARPSASTPRSRGSTLEALDARR